MLSVDALVSYAEELEAESSGTGLTWLKARRTEAIAKMDGGGQYEYISTTVNGQSFSRTVNMTAQEWFEVLQLAIQQLNGTAVRITYPHFHDIPH